MDPRRLRALLRRFQKGELDLDAVLTALRQLPFEDLGDAKIDHHRRLRRGVPEIIYGQGKTPEQVVRISKSMLAAGGPVLATRLSAAAMEALQRDIPAVRLHPTARLAVMGKQPRSRSSGIVICAAGTSDTPVAEEAAVCLQALGHQITRLTDVGVAGLHRLLGGMETLEKARVVIAVAGMEGALPSVITGLVACPVIGVPTSVGYGAAFGGLSALLAMLNSCAGGLVVVNIDNGVGAALAADVMVRRLSRK